MKETEKIGLNTLVFHFYYVTLQPKTTEANSLIILFEHEEYQS